MRSVLLQDIPLLKICRAPVKFECFCNISSHLSRDLKMRFHLPFPCVHKHDTMVRELHPPTSQEKIILLLSEAVRC